MQTDKPDLPDYNDKTTNDTDDSNLTDRNPELNKTLTHLESISNSPTLLIEEIESLGTKIIRYLKRISQLANLNSELKKKNTELRRQMIVREDKIRSQANTLRHIHEVNRLKNLQKAPNVE